MTTRLVDGKRIKMAAAEIEEFESSRAGIIPPKPIPSKLDRLLRLLEAKGMLSAADLKKIEERGADAL